MVLLRGLSLACALLAFHAVEAQSFNPDQRFDPLEAADVLELPPHVQQLVEGELSRFQTNVSEIESTEQQLQSWLLGLSSHTQHSTSATQIIIDEQELLQLITNQHMAALHDDVIASLRAIAPDVLEEIDILQMRATLAMLRQSDELRAMLPAFDPFVDLHSCIDVSTVDAAGRAILKNHTDRLADAAQTFVRIWPTAVYQRPRMVRELVANRSSTAEEQAALVDDYVAVCKQPVLLAHAMFEETYSAYELLCSLDEPPAGCQTGAILERMLPFLPQCDALHDRHVRIARRARHLYRPAMQPERVEARLRAFATNILQSKGSRIQEEEFAAIDQLSTEWKQATASHRTSEDVPNDVAPMRHNILQTVTYCALDKQQQIELLLATDANEHVRAAFSEYDQALEDAASVLMASLQDVDLRRRQFQIDNPHTHDPWSQLGEDFGHHEAMIAFLRNRISAHERLQHHPALRNGPNARKL
ncbi:MAG: hypothetical protein ACR2GY_09660 [Phycisphaerales bacterium]